MSLAKVLNTIMNADSTLNGLVDGIYFQNLPDTESMDNSNIIYEYSLAESVDTIGLNSVLKIYDLEITVLSPDTEIRDNIISAIESYLDNFSDSNLLDVVHTSSNPGIYGEKEQYVEILNYRITYKS